MSEMDDIIAKHLEEFVKNQEVIDHWEILGTKEDKNKIIKEGKHLTIKQLDIRNKILTGNLKRSDLEKGFVPGMEMCPAVVVLNWNMSPVDRRMIYANPFKISDNTKIDVHPLDEYKRFYKNDTPYNTNYKPSYYLMGFITYRRFGQTSGRIEKNYWFTTENTPPWVIHAIEWRLKVSKEDNY